MLSERVIWVLGGSGMATLPAMRSPRGAPKPDLAVTLLTVTCGVDPFGARTGFACIHSDAQAVEAAVRRNITAVPVGEAIREPEARTAPRSLAMTICPLGFQRNYVRYLTPVRTRAVHVC